MYLRFLFLFLLLIVSSWTKDCPNGLIFGDSCYSPHTDALSESDAEKVCEQECGHLVSIHSSEENSFVRNLFDTNTWRYIRIGAMYQNNFKSWIDNSSWSYENIGYQNSNFGSCYTMALTNDVVGAGKWMSSQCSKSLPFVCKRDIGAFCGQSTVVPNQCDGTQFLDSEGYIYSPNYPLSYTTEDQSCTYILSTPLGTTTTIRFSDFIIDESTTIALYTSIDDEDPFILFDYYNTPSGIYNSSSNTMKLVFHSKSNNGSVYKWSAFFSSTLPDLLTSTQPPITTCGSVRYYVPPATIEYPYFTKSLPTDQKCLYSISTGSGTRIQVSFEYTSLYNSGSVVVYDGASTTSPVLLTVQNGATGWYNSTSNHMLVYLNTYSSYDQFRAYVRTIL